MCDKKILMRVEALFEDTLFSIYPGVHIRRQTGGYIYVRMDMTIFISIAYIKKQR